jgi:UDPglucose 6-dehydrogenase
MKLGVTGYGVVGKATADVLHRMGHTIVVHDVSPERLEEAAALGFGSRHEAEGVDIDFVCVPETHLEAALAVLPESRIAVIRSTVPPGTIDRLSEQFSRPFAFMPEFLREATAQWDALNPPFVLVGSYDREQGATLAELFAPLMVQVIQVTPPVAEMVKLSLNAYLHTLVSFWNEIHLICEQVGLPSHLIGKLCAQDPRVVSYGATMHGQPVGGHCLPKDVAQLIAFAHDAGYSPDLLGEVQRVNQKLLSPDAPETRRHGPAVRNGHSAVEDITGILPPTGVVHLRW